MRTKCVLLVLLVMLLAWQAADAAFVLRTWTTPAAAPADGSPLSSSTNFTMRSRLGGPFVGSASSASFRLWGCGAYTPVEVAFFASLTEPLCVTLRWTAEPLSAVDGFKVLRATDPAGPFAWINPELVPPTSPASYEDRTVWPGTEFWYELWAVYSDGTEERVTREPVMVATGGTLKTKLYALSPNPFREQTVIQHDVASTVGGVRLTIYDVSGRVVKVFENKHSRGGRYSVTWDGTNDHGERVASGVYFCSLEADGTRETRPVVFLK